MNFLVTPNVVINSLLLYDKELTHPQYVYFLENSMNFFKKNFNCHSIYMTDVDYNISKFYYDLYANLLIDLFEINKPSNLAQRNELINVLDLITDFIQLVKVIVINETILDIASDFFKINPSDTIRLAVSVAEDYGESYTKIDGIITWEPSHFCQEPDEFYRVRNNISSAVTVKSNPIEDENKEFIIQKQIYTPSQFISRFVFCDIDLHEAQINNHIFELVRIEIISASDIESQSNLAKIVIRYNDEYEQEFQLNSSSGPISSLLLAIYLCIKKILNEQFENNNIIRKSYIQDIIFSVIPTKGSNSEVIVDISLEGTEIKNCARGKNLLWTAAEAYIGVINCVINQ